MKPASDRGILNADSARNTVDGPSGRAQDLCGRFAIRARVKVALNAFLVTVMLAALHHNKVVRGVVGSVAVSVVYYFIRGKWAAQHFLGDYAMLIEIGVPAFAYDAISASSKVTTFPVPMVGTVQPLDLAFSYWTVPYLLEAGRTESSVPKRAVFLGGHLVSFAKVRVCYLHLANHAAKLAANRVFSHGMNLLRGIIPQSCIPCNLTV